MGLCGELLADALGRTLEEAAFVFAERCEAPPPYAGALLQARLAYEGCGAEQGELVLTAPRTLATTLAANLLGEEDGSPEAERRQGDALGELLNMIAGAVVFDLFGPDARCALGLPRVAEVDAAEGERVPGEASAAATLVEEQGRRIDLAVRLGERRP
jgi:hypothetical protein